MSAKWNYQALWYLPRSTSLVSESAFEQNTYPIRLLWSASSVHRHDVMLDQWRPDSSTLSCSNRWQLIHKSAQSDSWLGGSVQWSECVCKEVNEEMLLQFIAEVVLKLETCFLSQAAFQVRQYIATFMESKSWDVTAITGSFSSHLLLVWRWKQQV